MSFACREHIRSVCILYKRILRLHKGLPEEIRIVGDQYVKDEFKRHKDVGENEAKIFTSSWQDYCATLAKQLSGKGLAKRSLGRDLEEQELESLSEQHLGQLYELKQETEKPFKRP